MSTLRRTESRLTPPRAAAVAGVLFAVLMGAIITIVRLAVPPAHVDPGVWINDPQRRNAVRFAVHLAPFAGIAFLWFVGVLRNQIGEFEDQFFATAFLGSALLFVNSLFGAAAVTSAMVDIAANNTITEVHREVFVMGRSLIGTFLNVFGIKMAGVFIMSTSTIVLRTGILPRWLSFLGFSSAIVLLAVITSWPWIALLFPFWMLVLSLYILLTEIRQTQV
jgi:hypothetical protein